MHNLIGKAAIALASSLILGLAVRATRQRQAQDAVGGVLSLHDLDPDTADAVRRIHRRLLNNDAS